VLDLRKLADELIATGCYCGGAETASDREVLDAVSQSHRDRSDRNKTLVAWLQQYRVLMSFLGETRIRVADEILGFADDRYDHPLGLD
jgi:hypothetical protein